MRISFTLVAILGRRNPFFVFKGAYRVKLLEDRIKKDGQVLPGDVLKINSFLNHQVDPELMMAIGDEFARLFKDAGVKCFFLFPVSAHVSVGLRMSLYLRKT